MGHGLSGDPALQLVQPAPCAIGDLNCDEVIDILDVAQVASAWSTTAWSIGYNPHADLVHDGRIDIADIATVVVLWQPH